MKNAALSGRPYAENLHVRFDEGEVASYPPTVGRPEGVAMRGAKPRRGSLLYKKNCLLISFVLFLGTDIRAADFSVVDYGARTDGAADATAAIQSAIDACAAAGGGRVVVPTGGTYVSRRLSLRSDVELHIAEGATLKCSDEIEKFPVYAPTDVWRWNRPVRWNPYCFFYTCGQTNVAVTGRGTIDGNSLSERFHKRVNGRYNRTSDTNIVARGLFFVGCRNVRVEDVLYKDACGWTTFFLDCDQVDVRRMRIRCNPARPNGDGLHFGGCRDVRVSGCDIDANDDAIILRAHQEQMAAPRACERVTVEDCTLRSNQFAVRIGWTGDAPVRDCVIRNIDCPYSFRGIGFTAPKMYDPAYTRDPPRGNGIPIPDFPLVPFGVENVRFENVRLTSRTVPFIVSIGGWERCEGLENVTFSNCRFRSRMAPVFACRPEDNLAGWTLSDVTFEILKPKGSLTPNCGVFFDNGRDISLERVKWTCVPDESPEWYLTLQQCENGEWESYVDPKTGYLNLRRAKDPKPPTPICLAGAEIVPKVDEPSPGVKRFTYELADDGRSLVDVKIVVEMRTGATGVMSVVRIENREKAMDVVGFEGPYFEAGSFRPGSATLRVNGVCVDGFPRCGRGLKEPAPDAPCGWHSCGDRPKSRRKESDTRVAEDRTRAAYVAGFGERGSVEVLSDGWRRDFSSSVGCPCRPRFRYDDEFGTADVGFDYRVNVPSGGTVVLTSGSRTEERKR